MTGRCARASAQRGINHSWKGYRIEDFAKRLYALQAIMTLGRRYGTETIKIRDIAIDSDLPENFSN
jgi:hypothetical protein